MILRGFVEDYTCWSNHGEQRTCERNDDIVIDLVDGDDEGVKGNTDVMNEDDTDIDLEEMLRHIESHVLRDIRDLDNFEASQKASKELLYE